MIFDEITADFARLGDWEDRRCLIERGRTLAPPPRTARTEARNCRAARAGVSGWPTLLGNGIGERMLHFAGDSDAYIVRGLIAVLIAATSDRPARKAVEIGARRRCSTASART
jgi:cysteine desulfuration protein SufE